MDFLYAQVSPSARLCFLELSMSLDFYSLFFFLRSLRPLFVDGRTEKQDKWRPSSEAMGLHAINDDTYDHHVPPQEKLTIAFVCAYDHHAPPQEKLTIAFVFPPPSFD